jgi:hypothetical protein
VVPETTPLRRSPQPPSPGRFAAVLLTAIALTAGGMRVADALPSWWHGEPRGVQRYGSVGELQRELRTRLLIPSFFPDEIAWPPSRVLRAPGDGRPVALVFHERAGPRLRLLIAQAIDGDVDLPPVLVPPLEVVWARALEINGAPARLAGVRDGDRLLLDLTCLAEGRRVRLRYAGEERALLRIARSLHRGSLS